MSEYAIYTRFDVVQALPTDRAQRRKVFQFFELLSRSPSTEGDYEEKDRLLRSQQVKIVGKYAVVYWFDAPVKTVMIVSLRHADRSSHA